MLRADRNQLHTRFENLCEELTGWEVVNPQLIEKWFNDIEEDYAQPDRFYHTLDHIAVGMEVLHKLQASVETRLAFLHHDVIYNAGEKNNEYNSAQSMWDLPWKRRIIDEARRLIMITKDHKIDWFDKNGCDMVVADLYSLGSDWDIYKKNSKNIRKEYAAFSDPEWLIGRNAFLRGMAVRQIFPPFQEYQSLELQAHNNIEQELKELNV